MRVFITGAEGFVGGHLLQRLQARGHDVRGSCLPGLERRVSGVDLEPVDLLDREELSRVLERADPEVIVHLAGLSDVAASWNDLAGYFRVNVVGTECVMDSAGGRKVILASSAEVYGALPEDQLPAREETAAAPRTPYAMSKAAAELVALRGGAIVARCFNLIGPGQSPRFALPSFAEQLAGIRHRGQEPVLRVGNLEARRDFVDVRDGAAAYEILALEGKAGQIYNVASGESPTVRDMLDRLISLSGAEVRVEIDETRLRPADVPMLCGDARRLEALGWRREHGIDGALEGIWSDATRRVKTD